MLAIDESPDPEVVGNAQAAEHPPPLGDHRDPLRDTPVGAHSGDVHPIPFDGALGARNDAGDGAEERRLPGPVAADNADPRASRYLEIDVPQGERAMVTDLESADGKRAIGSDRLHALMPSAAGSSLSEATLPK
jgi:hypothetical protein